MSGDNAADAEAFAAVDLVLHVFVLPPRAFSKEKIVTTQTRGFLRFRGFLIFLANELGE